MADRKVEDVDKVHRSKRVFINNLDSYASKCIAKFLNNCVVGSSLTSSGDLEEYEEQQMSQTEHKVEGTFKIVGTVTKPSKADENKLYVLEEYYLLTREDLLQHLMDCDIIIYNINDHDDQIDEASWAVTALHAKMARFGGPKMFILLSTVMTWALSKPVDPDDPAIPFTEEDYRRRRAHPNFKAHINAEKLVVKMGKTKKALLSTYVVASALQYGMGEQVFHHFFKMSWLGYQPIVPDSGKVTPILPTIHIHDLAAIIQNVIDQKPSINYLVAVDDSKNTLEDIVKAISNALGPGQIQKVPKEDVFLTEDLRQIDIDSILVNLRLETVYVKDKFNVHWVSDTGPVENMGNLVEEYKQTRGLLPIRMCVLGPPAVGKSTVTEKICQHYKLHHIRLKETIAETFANLEATIRMSPAELENEDAGTNAQELLDTLKENMEQNGGRLEDQLVVRIIKDKLKSKPCKNQGYVLDGFPQTYEQARELFSAEEEEEDTKSKGAAGVKKNIPEFVFSLGASDKLLKDRVLNLPESQVAGTSYSQEQFLRHLATYRQSNMEDETVLNYFDDLDNPPHHIEITSSDDLEYLVVTEHIIKTVGPHRNYGPTSQEQEEKERRSADIRLQKERLERAESERKEAEEAAQRASRWEEWSKSLEEVKRAEHELLEAHSGPLRNYLMANVMPTLTQGLIECAKTRPEDPIDFLAEYLFRKPQFE